MAISVQQFIEQLAGCDLLPEGEARSLTDCASEFSEAVLLANRLVAQGKLTRYQADQLLAGKTREVALGNYVILDRVGVGGMGEVYQARHRRMNRTVAIKVLPAASLDSPDKVRRFQREVEAAARLDHPNIVIAHDADCVNGKHFLVMQYVEGRELSWYLRNQGPLPVEQAVGYVIQAARGLEYAHAQGVIHRDLKPSNLMVDSRGTVKILDMGLALLAEESADVRRAEDLTGTGQVMGTLDYMSPEQAEDTHLADARSDIYSLGCTLFCLLTGRTMYQEDSVVRKLIAHREKPIPSICDLRPEVPPELDAVYRRMVAKNPRDRFQSMTEVITALEECAATAIPAIASASTESVSGSDLHEARARGWEDTASDVVLAASQASVSGRPQAGGSDTHDRQDSETLARPAEETVDYRAQKPTETSIHYRPIHPDLRRRRFPWLILLGVVALLGGLWFFLGDRLADVVTPRGPGETIPPVGQQDDGKQLPPDQPPAGDAPSFARFVQELPEHKLPVRGVVFSPDGKYLVSGSETIHVWDTRQKELVGKFPGFEGGIKALAFSPDGQWFASTGDGFSVRLWQCRPAGPVAKITGHVRTGWCLAVSPGGKWLATANDDTSIQLWDVARREPGKVLTAHKQQVTALDFSPDGKLLASASEDLRVGLWNFTTGRPDKALQGHTEVPWCVAFSPDGQRLASGGADRTVRLWNVNDKSTTHVLKGHTAAVTSLDFTPNGKRLLSTDRRGSVRLWDVTEGRALGRIEMDQAELWAVAVSPDGISMATGGNRTVKLWAISSF